MSNPVGILYVVATPIGNLDDISARALAVLRQVDLIAAEDTRHSQRLLQHFGIARQLFSLHEHNERQAHAQLIQRLLQGQSVALVSDAGTPLISDPGYVLVREARAQGIRVCPLPGACAFVAALSAAGLPSDRFRFEGFLPARAGERKAQLRALQQDTATLIFYESPHRILDSLQDICEVLGPAREVVLARELTKTFETIHGAPIGELVAWVAADENQRKGEFVLLVRGAADVPRDEISITADEVLAHLLSELPVKQAAALAARITGEKKNKLYQRALAMQQAED